MVPVRPRDIFIQVLLCPAFDKIRGLFFDLLTIVKGLGAGPPEKNWGLGAGFPGKNWESGGEGPRENLAENNVTTY